ncbi:MAG: pyruvate formate lyase family protein [Ignavibacteriaceae bacterium]
MAAYNFKTELEFTETYKKYKDEHPAIREAMCLKVQYPAFFTEIQDKDLFAGRIKNTLVGITPDEWGTAAFGYYCVKDKIFEELKNPELDEETREKVLEMVKYWDKESTSAKLRAAYPEEMAKYLPSDNWMGEPGISFPLYRLTGGNINWDKLLKKGIPGLMQELELYKATALKEKKDEKLFEGMKIALDILSDVCLFYAKQAKEIALSTTDKGRKKELETIADTLEIITISAPKNLREAIQLFWLYSYVADIRNYGRMDVYLGDFYLNDIEAGILTEGEALSLLQSLWKLMADQHTVVHSRVIIGGKGRPNEKNADKFALLAMEASRTVLEIEPQLSLRIYDGINPALIEKAIQVIGEGRTFPIIYNDDVNIKAVQQVFGFDELTAQQYVPYGCGEYIIDHKSFGTPSGVINLLKALEITMHNGVDPWTGKTGGLQLGKFEDFKTFDELWNGYTKQVEFFTRMMADQETLEYKVAGEHAPFLYLSLLYDNCLESGKGAFSGGMKYLGGTFETYGNTNTADSLTAIKELVYEKKVISHDELLKAIDANFDGYEKIRQKLLNVPKYGNDNEDADCMLVKVHEHICNYTKQQAERAGLHSYLVVVINNSANTLLGHWTIASPDGRKSGEPMANGNNPSGGSDKNGVTAFLNSLTKPSPFIHAGAVQNMKFSRDMFTAKKDILKALLETYYDNGGAQAMITVVDKNELERAMAEPEKYQHVFVRVGGFSARFVELSRDVQLEILSRTLY